MTPFARRRAVDVLLAASLLLNAAMIASLARSGGLRRMLARADVLDLPVSRLPFQEEAEARFRKLPAAPGEIVFAGDSLIAAGPWAEFYTEVHNRGIGGDRVAGVLGRLDEILGSRPRKLFLLVGANDLAADVPDSQLLRQYRMLLQRARRESPGTAITVLAIFPVNASFPEKPTYDNARVAGANRKLRELVAEFPGVRFLDLAPILGDGAGNLRREFSTDAMHINIDGYLAIREALRGPVLEETPRP